MLFSFLELVSMFKGFESLLHDSMDLAREFPSLPEEDGDTRKFANRQLESDYSNPGPEPWVAHLVCDGFAVEERALDTVPCPGESASMGFALGNQSALTILDFTNGGVHRERVSWASSFANSSEVTAKSLGRL